MGGLGEGFGGAEFGEGDGGLEGVADLSLERSVLILKGMYC